MPRAYSALDFVTKGLLLLGVLPEAATPSAEQAADGFDTLNEWIDSLGVDRSVLVDLTPTTHSLSVGVPSYTIGVGGTFNRSRPVWIDRWSLVPDRSASPLVELAHGPALTMSDYQGVVTKSTAGSYPTQIYYDQAWTGGLGRIYVYPVPNTSTADLKLYIPNAIAEFADLSTAYTFTPGLARAIRYNLAVELAAEYPGFPPSDLVQRIALQSLAAIKRSNYQPTVASIEGMGGGWYDIRSDSYVRGRRG